MAFASSVFQENAVLSQQGGLSGSWGPKKDLFIPGAGFWEVDLASSRGWDLPREIVPVADPGFVTAVQCIRQRDSGALLWLVRMAWLCQSSVGKAAKRGVTAFCLSSVDQLCGLKPVLETGTTTLLNALVCLFVCFKPKA